MSGIIKFWHRIPRKGRICIQIICILLCCLAIYTYIGAPVFSVEAQFRRYERSNMVGPSEILGTVNLETGFDSYQKMILADDGDGIIFYCYDHVELEDPQLIWRSKTSDITVLGAPYPTDARTRKIKSQYPVFVFDNYPDAVLAEMELTLTAEYFGESFEKTYTLTSKRTTPGYFQFILGTTNRRGLGIEGYAIQMFALISGYEGKYYQDWSVPVTVRLYNEANELLCERSLEITSVMTQAHLERGE